MMRSANGRVLKNIVDTTWRSNLAYAIGLIASDGYLHKNTKRIYFSSKDKELVALYQKAVGIKAKIGKAGRGGEIQKSYFKTTFKSSQFYSFLNTLGLTAAKSKTIRSVKIPDKFFSDFLRGIFDGDGTFWTAWDTRWPNSFVFHIEIATASKEFAIWLKHQLTRLYNVNGHLKQGAGVYIIRYAKADTRTLFKIMYQNKTCLFLNRKHQKLQAALDFDRQLKQSRTTPKPR